MSNDMLSVPRELLEHIYKDQAVSVAILDQLNMLLAQSNTCNKDAGQRELVAKPSPTLWLVRIPDEPDDPENSPAEYEYASTELERDGLLKNKGAEVVQVYCNYPPAQAPVVLPERVDPDYFDSIRATGIGWNACIDEFKRLNPTL